MVHDHLLPGSCLTKLSLEQTSRPSTQKHIVSVSQRMRPCFDLWIGTAQGQDMYLTYMQCKVQLNSLQVTCLLAGQQTRSRWVLSKNTPRLRVAFFFSSTTANAFSFTYTIKAAIPQLGSAWYPELTESLKVRHATLTGLDPVKRSNKQALAHLASPDCQNLMWVNILLLNTVIFLTQVRLCNSKGDIDDKMCRLNPVKPRCQAQWPQEREEKKIIQYLAFADPTTIHCSSVVNIVYPNVENARMPSHVMPCLMHCQNLF